MKISNLFLASIVFVIFCFFIVLNHFDVELTGDKKLELVDFLLTSRADSIRTDNTSYYIYTREKMIKVEIIKYERFVSPKDTVITLIDSIGNQIGDKVSLKKIKPETKNRIIEIINLSK